MTTLTGTFTCPLCGELIAVTVTLSTVPIDIDGGPAFTTVAAPQYSHACPPPRKADGEQ